MSNIDTESDIDITTEDGVTILVTEDDTSGGIPYNVVRAVNILLGVSTITGQTVPGDGLGDSAFGDSPMAGWFADGVQLGPLPDVSISIPTIINVSIVF